MTKTDFLNSQLSIVKLNGVKLFDTNKTKYIILNGHFLKVDGFGLVSFIDDNENREIHQPYTPIGGLSALKSIIKGGGFTDYLNVNFIKY
jgi:hypothetical protein